LKKCSIHSNIDHSISVKHKPKPKKQLKIVTINSSVKTRFSLILNNVEYEALAFFRDLGQHMAAAAAESRSFQMLIQRVSVAALLA
jgi:hypothetical protein